MTTTEQPGRIARWRVTEPVRFYTWPGALLGLIAIAVVVIDAGRPFEGAIVTAAVALVQFLGIEAARSSVLSPAAMIRSRQKEPRP